MWGVLFALEWSCGLLMLRICTGVGRGRGEMGWMGVGWGGGKKDLLDVTASNVTRVLLRLSAFAAA